MSKYRVLSVLLVVILLIGPFASTVLAAEPCTHKIRWGESLYWISWLYGISTRDIADANGITNWNYIYAGDELVLPGTDCSNYVEHKVVWGDTLLAIAAKYGVTVREIAQRNALFNWNLIFAGTTLKIPVAGATGEGAGDTGAEEAGEAGEAAETPETAEVPEMQAAIIITSPGQDENVSSPVTVTGYGSAFENTLAVDVIDQNGQVIGQGSAVIDAEVGQKGAFTGVIEYTAPASEQVGRIAVYSVSPRDGAVEQLTSVTVKLVP